MNFVFLHLSLAVTVLAIVTPYGFTGVANTGGMQAIPGSAKTPGTFSTGKDPLLGEPYDTLSPVPDVYGARELDIPIGRYFHGHLNFYPTVNDPTKNTDVWGGDKDNAENSACGIPANAYFISRAAIHPYFLKYAGLDRYCMQDVCIWFWKEDGSSDMLLKVTDICTPDSADGVPCLDPMDIKVDRTKAGIIMNNLKEPVPSGDQYPDKVWWLFTKCSSDVSNPKPPLFGLAQPAYVNNSNWFTEPYLPNNNQWVQYTATQQYINNQRSYPAKGWDTYPPGLYNISRYAQPITDWDPSNPPSWSPIAGGKGSSLANSSSSWPSSDSSSSRASTSWEMIVAQETPPAPTEASQKFQDLLLLVPTTSTQDAEATITTPTTSSLGISTISPPSKSLQGALSTTKSAKSATNTIIATLTVVPLPSMATTCQIPSFTSSTSTSTSYVCVTKSIVPLASTSTVYVCGTVTWD